MDEYSLSFTVIDLESEQGSAGALGSDQLLYRIKLLPVFWYQLQATNI